ncbi:MAG: nucleoside hydrolase [Novosphingobium sp.]|nr:nucleoside hydrolase [Novosphingobium sp.]
MTASTTRRTILASMGSLTALCAFPGSAQSIRQGVKARVIIDNDFAGDPDGLVALAHHLLSPSVRCPLVTSSALDANLAKLGGKPANRTALAARDAAAQMLEMLSLATPPVLKIGAESFGTSQDQLSEAAHAIVQEALRDDPLPLFVACGGPLTNVAAALRLEPAIAKRLTLVWIGGAGYPTGGNEYNLMTDIASARQVIERSDVPLWQIPQPAYAQFQISVSEMTHNFKPLSPLTEWLYTQYTLLPPFVELGGTITMGDSPLVLLTALSSESSKFSTVAARHILDGGTYGKRLQNRTIRVYEQLDARLALSDMAASMLRTSSR